MAAVGPFGVKPPKVNRVPARVVVILMAVRVVDFVVVVVVVVASLGSVDEVVLLDDPRKNKTANTAASVSPKF